MTVHNDTPLADALTFGVGPDGTAHVAVVLKASFRLPDTLDGPLVPLDGDEAVPIWSADTYVDDDPTGSLFAATDLVVHKPKTDVLVVGSAHAPAGTTVTELDVALRLGVYSWALRVTGDRRWIFPTRAMVVPVPSTPEPFAAMPLVWERAFGGLDRRAGARTAENPVGRGLLGEKTREAVDGTPLPNIESPRHAVASWDDAPPPAGWAPTCPDWQPRVGFIGKDLSALHPVFGLASDFSTAYHNAAAPALQVPHVAGDEAVELQHLTPDRYRRFRLPGWRPRATLGVWSDGLSLDEALARGPIDERPTAGVPLALALDTIEIRPDEGRIALVWRGSMPLGEDLALEDATGRLAGYAVDLKRPDA